MSTYSDLVTDIDNNIDNYAPNAFHNKWLWNILRRIISWINSGGTTGPTIAPALTVVNSSNFTSSTDCPIPPLAGLNITVLWLDPPKPLILGTDFTILAGGGFRILIPGFNSGAATFTFWVFTTT
jgi:hypothetical protein